LSPIDASALGCFIVTILLAFVVEKHLLKNSISFFVVNVKNADGDPTISDKNNTEYEKNRKHKYCLRNAQYRCEGEAYNDFTRKMMQYVSEKNRTFWGTRRFPLPRGVSILVLGNSHTRQTVNSLLCQYSDVITSRSPFTTDGNFSAGHGTFLFSNEARLVVLTNSPLVYSKNWTSLLQKYDTLHLPLENYTAIVLGQFNPPANKSTNRFQEQMLAFEHQYPEEIHYSTVPAPTLYEVSQLFPRTPILAVSMFAEYGLDWEIKSLKTVSVSALVQLVRGRAHIDAIGIECGTDGIGTVTDCCNSGDTTQFRRLPENMHRCTGAKGGHADLLAWDVIEALHEMII
jgi:hypothetical protein